MTQPIRQTPEPRSESTATLLARIRRGDRDAEERLFCRYLPILRNWARGRLPCYARTGADTSDLVQITLGRALRRLDEFEPHGEGAFLAYLRQILLNAVRKEIRRERRRPGGDPLPDEIEDRAPSLVERAIGRERLALYETALAALTPRHQEAVILRVEMGFTHRELAEALGCATPDAARMVVARALRRLVEVMDV